MTTRAKYNSSRAEQSRAEQSRAEQSRAEQSRRFIGFDILKFLCAFLVVCIHAPFPGAVGAYFTALTRIAVPIFFMITGYYYFSMIEKCKLDKQLKKITYYIIVANLLYLVWNGIFALAKGGLSEYIFKKFTFKNLLKFLIFNESPFAVHLWYLSAILYVLLIFSLRKDVFNERLMRVLTPLLLTTDLLLGKYSVLLFGIEFPYIVVRNFLFVGIPYFLIGMMIRKWNYDIHQKKALIACIFFSVMTLIERTILIALNANATRDHYISTTFLAVSVFLLFKEVYAEHKANCIEKWMAGVGQKYSAWIYIIHPIFIKSTFSIMNRLALLDYYKYVAPIAVFAVSTSFVIAAEKGVVTLRAFLAKKRLSI